MEPQSSEQPTLVLATYLDICVEATQLTSKVSNVRVVQPLPPPPPHTHTYISVYPLQYITSE
jgi:hypothetical protein